MATFTNFQPGQFSWVDLMSADIDESRSFYGDLFGWSAVDQDTQGGPPYVLFHLDGDTIAGMGAMSPEMRAAGVPPTWNSYVTVEDVQAAVARAEELGGRVVMPAMQVMQAGHMAGLQDPTGGTLFVWQPLEHIGATRCNDPNTFCWNELATRDLDTATAYYGSLFGWTFEETAGGPSRYFACKLGDRQNGGLMQIDEDWTEMLPHWGAYFAVESADETVRRVTELGGTVCAQPFDVPEVGRMAVAADPHGAMFNVIALIDAD